MQPNPYFVNLSTSGGGIADDDYYHQVFNLSYETLSSTNPPPFIII